MLNQKILLRDSCPALAALNSEAFLVSYVRDLSPEINEAARYPTVIVCPGGAYRETSDREAEPIALALLARGFNAFVLRYSVAPARYPQALGELSAAISYIRDNAELYHADPDKIITMGFSAGGHLAASAGILWNKADIIPALGLTPERCRPNAMVLSYPVITAEYDYANLESFEMLLGESASDPAARDLVSLEKQVSPETAPAFIWHTLDDNCVPSENSLMLASALKRAGVSFELHLFPHGAHAIALGTELTACPLYPQHVNAHASHWFEEACRWLDTL